MTKLLTQAFEKASELPEDLQDQLAQELLEEIEWEARWDSATRRLTRQTGGLAEKLCGNFGRVRPREWDSTIFYSTCRMLQDRDLGTLVHTCQYSTEATAKNTLSHGELSLDFKRPRMSQEQT